MEDVAYEDFSLWIEPLDIGPGYRVTARSLAGEARETALHLPVSTAEHGTRSPAPAPLPPDGAVPTRDLVPVKGSDDEARRCGDELFRTLFQGRVGRLFASSAGPCPDPRRGLRIKLHLDPEGAAAAALSGLPWELLYDAETKDYLGINPLTPVVRYLELQRPTRLPAFLPPLRILLAASNPAACPALDLRRERSLIEQAWTDDPEVVIRIVECCDRERLREELCDASFDVLHFMGHAGFDDETGTGALLLEGGQAQAQPVPGGVLADLLKGRLPRLVVLNACNSARALSGARRDFFSGLAAALVMGGVPAVVAMRAPVADSAAIHFSKVLYRQLARGQAVDAAAAEGRRALYLDAPGSTAWATPVVFMRVPDGRLFEAQEPMPRDNPAESASAAGAIDSVDIEADQIDLGESSIANRSGAGAAAGRPGSIRIRAGTFRATGAKISNQDTSS